MKEADWKAAKIIFEEKNKVQDEFSIDLHGLKVQEAITFLEERIEKQKKDGKDHLIVIYGKGIHSEGNVRKIKPEVEKLLGNLKLKYESDNPNPGCCYVTL